MPKGLTVNIRQNFYSTLSRAVRWVCVPLLVAGGLVLVTPLSASSSPAISQTVVASGFSIPFGLAIDHSGDLIVGDVGDNDIYSVTPNGTRTPIVTPFGGSYAVTLDDAGDLYYANQYDNNIYKVTPNGTQTTYATGFSGVFGLATDSLGDLFVSSYNNNTVTEIAPNGTQTLIGTFNGPWGLATDSQNNLYVADYSDGTVWKVTPGGVRTVVASGLATGPMSLAIDPSGNLYVGESFNDEILEIAPNRAVSVFTSGFSYPAGLALDAQGNLYAISATTNEVVEFHIAVNPPTNLAVTTVLGTESATWTGDGTATSYTCTLMFGFDDPTTFSVTTTSDTCKFDGLTSIYGIRVVANNGLTTSSSVVGFPATPTTTTTTTTVPRPTLRTITCVKGKSVRRVRGVSPHCPAGYKLK